MTTTIRPRVASDELFSDVPTPRAAAAPTRITCAVCGMFATHDGNGVCVECTRVNSAQTAYEAAYAAMSDADSQRWQRLLDARLAAFRDVSKRVSFDKAYRRAKAENSAFSALIAAYEMAQQAYRAQPLAPPDTPQAGESAVPEQAQETTCKSCGAAIVWATTHNGRNVPLSLATVVTRGGKRYAKSHFTDCKQAKGWSKKAAAK